MDGNYVKAIRLYLDKSQPEFASMLGVSLSSIAMVEAGHRSVTDRLRFKIAKHVELDEDFYEQFQRFKKYG